ncbi:MAG: class I SAM-dependent methyltransferase, partial [Acidobacteriota bacterium]|nr:class I SAM-dependent methyltransferase [Acidobacteriota bacterium]
MFSSTDQWLTRKILAIAGNPSIRLVIGRDADRSTPPNGSKPSTTVVISDRRTLAKLALDPEVAFGDAYADGKIQIRGDMVRFLEDVLRTMQDTAKKRMRFAQIRSWWLDWLENNSARGSRKNIHRHYDLSNDFYKLWLDERMVYTCAYFPTASASLEDAQVAKMDHVCRKLRLQPREKVVEAGCGWGALALHMAKRYGAAVRAFNISHEQIAYAREQAKREGLAGRVEFVEDDYRNISGRQD